LPATLFGTIVADSEAPVTTFSCTFYPLFFGKARASHTAQTTESFGRWTLVQCRTAVHGYRGKGHTASSSDGRHGKLVVVVACTLPSISCFMMAMVMVMMEATLILFTYLSK